MLNQATHWMEFVGTAFDALLLVRVLLLKLHRVYLFITLACVLALFFDVTSLLLHGDEEGNFRVFLYSRFLYAIAYPLVAWDVFEEVKLQVSKLRRLAATRLISGLLFTVIFALILTSFLDSSDNRTDSSLVITLALVLWLSASTACLGFLITMHRVMRSQSLGLPNNTFVWIYFYELSFGAEALYCIVTVLLPSLSPNLRASWINDVTAISFMTFSMVLTAWCIFKLRAVPAGIAPASSTVQLN